eukprot:3407260-Prymnesium_polylepis.2
MTDGQSRLDQSSNPPPDPPGAQLSLTKLGVTVRGPRPNLGNGTGMHNHHAMIAIASLTVSNAH